MLIESILYASIACLCQAPGGAVPAGGAPQGAERVLASFPLREIVGGSQGITPPLVGSFLGFEMGPSVQGLIEEGRSSRIAVDELVELIGRHIDPEGESEGFRLDLDGQSLVISGSPAQVAAGREVVRFLESQIARSVQVSATVYEVNAGVRIEAKLAAGELKGLARDWRKLWTASSVVHCGDSVVLSKERWTRYVADVDVEVAQKASISDPSCFRMFEGVRVVVEPHALVGEDSLVVFSQFALGQRRGRISSIATSVRDQPSIQFPISETNNGCMSGRVEDGGTLLFASRGASAAGSNLVLAVTTSFIGRASQRKGQTGVYPVSALVSKSFTRRVDVDTKNGALQIIPLVAKQVAKRPYGSFDRSRLEDFLYRALSDRLDNDESVAVSLAGKFFVVRGDEAFHKRVREVLENLEKRSLKTVLVHATTTATELSRATMDLWGEAETKAVSMPWHQLSFPALLGRPHYAIRGVERAAIVDYAVEIAQAKAIANPVVEPVFSGVLVSLSAYAMADAVGTDLKVELSQVAPLERHALEGSQAGDLYLPETSRVSLGHKGRVTLDQVRSLGDGPKLTIDGQKTLSTQQRVEIRSH